MYHQKVSFFFYISRRANTKLTAPNITMMQWDHGQWSPSFWVEIHPCLEVTLHLQRTCQYRDLIWLKRYGKARLLHYCLDCFIIFFIIIWNCICLSTPLVILLCHIPQMLPYIEAFQTSRRQCTEIPIRNVFWPGELGIDLRPMTFILYPDILPSGWPACQNASPYVWSFGRESAVW